MRDFLEAIAIVILLGFIYIAILWITARLSRTVPNAAEAIGEDIGIFEDELEPPKTVIRIQEERTYINSSMDVFRNVKDQIGDKPAEYLILLLVSADSRLAAEIECTDKQGGYVRFPDIAMIVEYCVEKNANSIYIAHNHPHGTIYPSKEDIYYTAGLVRKLQKSGVRLKDHIIVVQNRYYSMKDNDKWGVVFTEE